MPFLRFFGAMPSEYPTTVTDVLVFWIFILAFCVLIPLINRRFIYGGRPDTVIRIYTPKFSPMTDIHVRIHYDNDECEQTPFSLDASNTSSLPETDTRATTPIKDDSAVVTGISMNAGHGQIPLKPLSAYPRRRVTTTTTTTTADPTF